MNITINSLLLISDQDLFQLIFEDACSLLNITLNLKFINSLEEADKQIREGFNVDFKKKPNCIIIDLQNKKSNPEDSIELVRKINYEYGNGFVLGILGGNSQVWKETVNKAQSYGASFWIEKSGDIELKLKEFKKDYKGFKEKSLGFKIY